MAAQTEWWQRFFTGLWLDVQRGVWSEGTTREDVDLIEGLLELHPPARLLDVPCGEGRIALELATRRYDVAGVDITLSLLEDARRQADERGLLVVWEHRDMRDLTWENEFDAVLNFWGSFGYFDEAGDARFVEAVYRALKPGGKFLIEGHIAETLLPIFQGRGWGQVGEVLLLEEREYDHHAGRVNVVWTFLRDGEKQTQSSSIRIYTYRELCALLMGAGFVTCGGFDKASRQPFKLGARRLVMVATK